jgi:hypothetical protein
MFHLLILGMKGQRRKLFRSTLATEWYTTSNNYSKSPHPPFGHLLPMSGEREK